MPLLKLTTSTAVFVSLAALAAAAEPLDDFAFHDGDRIVLLGGTSVEREVHYGYLETALTSTHPDLNLTFRNLGWSGDTVWAESRGIFDPPAVGYQRLLELVRELKPTVLFFAYGANESFAGESGVEPFVKQYETLLDDLAPLECRLVFFTPHQFETPSPPLPDASRHNPMLARYAQAIRELAERREAWLVDLFESTSPMTWTPEGADTDAQQQIEPPRGYHQVDDVWRTLPLTDNGIHLSAYGSLRVARMTIHQLQLPKAEFLMQLDADGTPESEQQATVSAFQSDGTSAKFQLQLSRLPEPPTPLFPADVEYFLVAADLPAGKYELTIDGQPVAANTTLLANFAIRRGPDFDHAERLRQAIVRKNTLFFHRWRPQNITYLTGFRKHEQGNNAVEIAQFDPLVAKAEAEIAHLRQPHPHRYEITPREAADGK